MSYSVEQFDKDLENEFAWPGGYQRYFITSDGAALSFKSATKNADLIREAIRDNDNCGWRVEACDINWENADLYCDDTSERIPSAYAD